jgi:Fur family transcriptional regulator, ferric uptake regulator
MKESSVPKLPKSFDFQEHLLKKRDVFTLDELKNILRSLNLKITDQRLLILKTLNEGTRKHVTAQEIFEKVNQADSSVGFATVYRLLKRLAESNLVAEIRVGGASTRYELSQKHHHDHITCTRCGTLHEFHNQELETLQENIAKKLGFILTSHVLELYGLCHHCRSQDSKTTTRVLI